MNKSELIKALANTTGETQAKVSSIVEGALTLIKNTVASGTEVELHGFGKFSAVKRAARIGRNPTNGEKMDIPAKVAPTFKPHKVYRDLLN